MFGKRKKELVSKPQGLENLKKFFVRVNSMIGLVPVITSIDGTGCGDSTTSIITSVNGVKADAKYSPVSWEGF